MADVVTPPIVPDGPAIRRGQPSAPRLRVQGCCGKYRYQRSWGKSKHRSVEFSLGYFTCIPIDRPKIIDRYAIIDSYFKRRGVNYGKNDLWIAATASAMGVTLLTTDRDFDAMVPLFLAREWIDPTPDRG
jgi:hypothetical protein